MSPRPMSRLTFQIDAREGGKRDAELTLTQGVIAGWTGRDRAAMERHIAELVALGVSRPPRTPIFYRVSVNRFTLADVIEVPGEASSGEAEVALLRVGGDTLVGLGSDHTDRAAETYNVTVSKQMCDKPLAPVLWPLADVADHWDALVLRSYIGRAGERRLYQEGRVCAMLAPDALLARFAAEHGEFRDGTILLGGTRAALGGLQVAAHFEMELEDPVLGRCLRHGYTVHRLPNAG
jgi:hypothetical protein